MAVDSVISKAKSSQKTSNGKSSSRPKKANKKEPLEEEKDVSC